jgi:hypothetical protein
MILRPVQCSVQSGLEFSNELDEICDFRFEATLIMREAGNV